MKQPSNTSKNMFVMQYTLTEPENISIPEALFRYP